jgi:hypothetical protein
MLEPCDMLNDRLIVARSSLPELVVMASVNGREVEFAL